MRDRLFLSLPAIIDDYQTIQEAFSGVIRGRWTPPENLHMTLCFYGDTWTKEALLERLASVNFTNAPSNLTGIGYFSKRRILYANVDNPALEALYDRLHTLFDLPVRQPFIAHVTLMRVKEVLDAKGLESLLTRYKERPIGLLGTTPELMQSELHRDGARYTLVKRFKNDHL